jgi:MYXO-CTERM domain-containing protein
MARAWGCSVMVIASVAWGCGQAEPATQEVAASMVHGARAALVADPLLAASAEAALTMSAGGSADRAGLSVALNADASFALVGVPYDDTTAGGTDSGSVRVFARTGSTWTEQATLLPADIARGDVYGLSVALSADGSRALVGAYWDSTAAGTRAGSARVFVRSGTDWTEEARLFATGAAPEDQFGTAVALDDAGTRAVIGAPYDDTAAGSDAGSARVFVRTGSVWTEEAALLAPDGAESDTFGSAVALSGDGTRVLVGAPWDDAGIGTYAGTAHVFVRAGATWSAETRLLGADTEADDHFGQALALSTDGLRAIVGAPYDDVGGLQNAGSVRVFARRGAGWVEDGTLTVGDPVAFEYLGWSVALGGGASVILAGLINDSTAGGFQTGSARVFLRGNTGWAEDAALIAADGAPSDGIGWSVALAADGSRAVLGAPYDETPAAVDGGSARVFRLSGSAALGAPCAGDLACVSGFCTDGVCCASRCGGDADDCQACAASLTGGVDGTCAPLAAAIAPTVTCRAATGACDATEVCSSASTTCPIDVRAPAGTACRTASGACDVAELCDGASADCPPDAFAPDTAPCGSAVRGACDAPDHCAGTSAACVAAVAVAGTTCRAASDLCDAEERCTGTDAECPADLPARAGLPCRDTTMASCDPAEACDGVAFTCPPDITMCGEVDAGMMAMDDAGVVPMVDAGMMAMDDAGMMPTVDAGPPDSGAPDAGDALDAGPDAGSPRVQDGGCGCRVAAHERDGRGALAVLVALGALLARRRRSIPRSRHA